MANHHAEPVHHGRRLLSRDAEAQARFAAPPALSRLARPACWPVAAVIVFLLVVVAGGPRSST